MKEKVLIKRYISLLRGINVGGKNKISMVDLKSSFERRYFQNVVTYINSGNVIFDSYMDENSLTEICEKLILEDFGLNIPVCIISASDLEKIVLNAPNWWNKDKDYRHDAFFTIPPITTVTVIESFGNINKEYEKLAYYNRTVFWSASKANITKTMVSRIVQNKKIYNSITIRNANTTLKLWELSKENESRDR